VRFTVASGEAVGAIAARLFQQNLINDDGLFVDFVIVEELDSQIEAGTYLLNQTLTIEQIARTLTDSSSSVLNFTILPGWRLEQVATAIDNDPRFAFNGAAFLGVVGRGVQVDPLFAQTVGLPQGASLEGFLYPETYTLPLDITTTELRDLLLTTFLENVGTQMLDDLAARDMSLFEAVTIASIVQREAIHNDEHPLIASVYQNRLDIGMKLDADPTVQYPLGSSTNWWPRITAADYTGVESDYNTYLFIGLPPGPIASPSLSAIRAAVYPAESTYLYFRADCRPDGYHNFATTYEEHLANGC
jgi:UPF0755 protein